LRPLSEPSSSTTRDPSSSIPSLPAQDSMSLAMRTRSRMVYLSDGIHSLLILLTVNPDPKGSSGHTPPACTLCSSQLSGTTVAPEQVWHSEPSLAVPVGPQSGQSFTPPVWTVSASLSFTPSPPATPAVS